jgi:SAM-dependent methyltransferase
MNEALEQESEKLARSWMRHEATWLRDYLVAGVEDPRLNIQSILSRHFLIRSFFGNCFEELMEEEVRFGSVMDWVRNLPGGAEDAELMSGILHALRQRADNVEGLPIPHFVSKTFARLSTSPAPCQIPNYIESFLAEGAGSRVPNERRESGLDTFQQLWAGTLASAGDTLSRSFRPLSLLEPGCGSANDYRFVESYGLGSLLDYTGFDLCIKNIANAQALFPRARFEVGNVFEIDAPDRSFDLCLSHDLFEHLSPAGLEVAIREVCRITRRSLCIGFFQMDEIGEHVIRPIEEYHWNLLSAGRMRELFASQGFAAHVVHIGTFLRQ